MTLPKHPAIQGILELLDAPSCLEKLPVVLSSGKTIRIEKLDMVRDLPILYDWVNQPYAIPYWQMNGPFAELQTDCEAWLRHPAMHTLVAYLEGNLLCQFDIYETTSDILRDYYEAAPGDLGIHLLLAPGKKPEASFSKKLLSLFLHLLFSSPEVQRVICEPDVENHPACNLVERLGFNLEKRLTLPNKTANLYILSRQRFELSTAF